LSYERKNYCDVHTRLKQRKELAWVEKTPNPVRFVSGNRNISCHYSNVEETDPMAEFSRGGMSSQILLRAGGLVAEPYVEAIPDNDYRVLHRFSVLLGKRVKPCFGIVEAFIVEISYAKTIARWIRIQ